MICSLTELKDKDVINICNGENLGYADDIRLDTRTAAVTGLILYGKPRFITYDQIRLIGKDVILVSLEKSVNMFNIDKT